MDENPYKSPESVEEEPVDTEETNRKRKPPSLVASIIHLTGGIVLGVTGFLLIRYLFFHSVGLLMGMLAIGAGTLSLVEAVKGFIHYVKHPQ